MRSPRGPRWSACRLGCSPWYPSAPPRHPDTRLRSAQRRPERGRRSRGDLAVDRLRASSRTSVPASDPRQQPPETRLRRNLAVDENTAFPRRPRPGCIPVARHAVHCEPACSTHSTRSVRSRPIDGGRVDDAKLQWATPLGRSGSAQSRRRLPPAGPASRAGCPEAMSSRPEELRQDVASWGPRRRRPQTDSTSRRGLSSRRGWRDSPSTSPHL